MNSKINKTYIFYAAIILLALGITYFRIENQKLKKDIGIIENNLNAKIFYDNNLLGVNINKIKLYSLNNGNDFNLEFKEGIVLYGNNKGCKKCYESVMSIYKNYAEKKNIFVVISNYGIAEFNPIRDYVLKYKNIIWDKYDSFDSAFGIDLRKTGPLLFYIKEGLIVSYCLIIDGNEKIIENYFTKLSQ
ncbi:MAG: hypothetical protein C0412_11700 [Flavobacterium sp.]|nr:hypothetical protein [Flavobacterium sp.]